jgi:hypothetical protein
MVVEANGAWVVVTELGVITGQTPKAKATAVHSAAFVRHIKVQTTSKTATYYVALVVPATGVAG